MTQFPLSFAQMDWIARYPSQPQAFSILMQFDRSRPEKEIRKAIYSVVSRHDALRIRTSYSPGIDGQSLVSDVPSCDLFDIGEENDRCSLHRFLREAPCLEREGPLRYALFAASDGGWYLPLVVDHLACDSWAISLLCTDIGRYVSCPVGMDYESEKGPSEKGPSLVDYVRRERARDRLLSDSQTRHEDYLRNCRGGLKLLPLSTHERSESFDCVIDDRTTALLGNLARQCHVTFAAILLAAVFALIYSLIDGYDAMVMVASHNRDRDTREMVALLGRKVPVRCAVEGKLSIREFVRHVFAEFIASLAVSRGRCGSVVGDGGSLVSVDDGYATVSFNLLPDMGTLRLPHVAEVSSTTTTSGSPEMLRFIAKLDAMESPRLRFSVVVGGRVGDRQREYEFPGKLRRLLDAWAVLDPSMSLATALGRSEVGSAAPNTTR